MRPFSSIAGNVVASFSGWEVTLVQLHRHQPPAIVGRLPITPPSYVWPPMQSPMRNATGFAFSGNRLVVAVGEEAIAQQIQSEIRIYEPGGVSGAVWELKAVIPNAAGPLLAEGDTLIARSLISGGLTDYRVYTRNEGGTDRWGESGVIEVPAAELIYDASLMAMNGGLLLVPDLRTDGTSSGEIHVFVRSLVGNSWGYSGAFSSPQPAAGGRFGAALALGGRDLLAVTASNVFGQDKGWGGSFTGATATIADDDAPRASLELPAVFEPAGGPRVAQGALVLSHESEQPVTITWQTSDASALSGADYTAASGQVTIPAGSLSAPLEVAILPDALTENTETFKLTVTQISGARLTEPEASWTIQDTDRPAVVRADDIVCAEGAPPVNAVVNLFPVAEPLAVNVVAFAPVLADHAGPVTDFGYAVPGVDWAGTPAVLHAAPATPVDRLLPLTGLQDTTEDGSRRGLLRFELPEGAVGASFSERLVHGPPLDSPQTFLGYDSLTTDGKWAAAIRSTLTGQSVVIYRNADAPGGSWTPWTVLPESVMNGHLQGVTAKLRGGRLVLHSAGLGTAEVFRPRPEGDTDRQWVLEAVLKDLPIDSNNRGMPMDFDGESLVLASHESRFFFANRGAAGDWTGRQHVDIPTNWSSGTRLSMTPGRLAIVRGAPVNATVHILERIGTGPAPWRLDPNSRIDLPEGALDNPLWTSGNVLVLGQKVYRRRDDGGWSLEQTLPDIVRGVDRGVIIGSTAIYADIGPSAAPWRVVAQPDSTLDWSSSFEFNAGTVVTRSSGLASVLKIMEAGMGLTITDRESFMLNPNETSLPEPRYAETSALVRIVAEDAAPVDIPITFETVPGGTAAPNLDYRPVKGTVIIPAGARSGLFAIPILPDTVPELDETLQVNFSAPEFGQLTKSSITVTIGSFAIHPFTRPPVFVPEPASGEALHQIPVNFSPASSTEVAASYRIAAGTAGAGDALLTQGMITIPPGMESVLVPVTVYADALTEGPESLSITLLTLGPYPITPLRVEVVIDDRASAGSEPDSFTAPQNVGIDFNSARNVLANDTSGHTTVSPSREPRHGTLTWREDGTFRYVPAANFIGTDRFAYASRLFTLPADTNWKWLHPRDGRDPALTVPGFQTNWMKPEFDASSWQNGKGLMAYGGIGQGAGAVTTDTDIGTPTSNRFTAYFRTSLTFANQPSEGVAVEFICDDAAIFYLNGVEIGRYAKAPMGTFATAPDTYPLLAPNALNDTEENQIQRLHFPAARFAAGENLFAVSVHNASATSSDLGLKVVGLTPGNFSTPTWVTVDVVDAQASPVLLDDLYVLPANQALTANSPLLDSRLFGSSVYRNDGLLGASSLPYDPILQVAIGGSAADNVTFDKDTGHFRLETLRNYYGTTGFTYRVRDKDGWSNTATVTITVPPSRFYDSWRAEAFGADSFASAGLPAMDEDGDGMADVFEYLFQRNPRVADATEPLQLVWNGQAWTLRFSARHGFGTSNISLKLESSQSLAEADWTWLATFDDADGEGSLHRLAPGISFAVQENGLEGRLYTVTLPPHMNSWRYFRLKAVEEPNVLFP
ncbi:MAG: Calx-beta domain-containing protein [Verrucomicrobiales bacterium]